MKTVIVTKFKKTLFALIALFCISCETDIPETDTNAPTFTFNISGDGFNQTFDQDDDFSSFQLNLRSDTEYSFIYSGGDAGGVKRISWQYPHDYIEFSTDIPSPWESSTLTFLSSLIYWNGDATNPTTGNILAGKLITNGDGVSISFSFLVRDFGGLDGVSNTTERTLNIYINEQNTEVIGL
ncbi:hypothetical protein [Aquimarina sp. SS2-1]|uniref:hypothetical protein n=1 Tax=Aquimarina besae TaxID=3342247 RepID=UPI0036730B9E